jgi:outer membrane autotransporter protein
MKRSITAVLAAIILLAGSGFAYGFAINYEDPTVTENQHALGRYFNTVRSSLPADISAGLNNGYIWWVYSGDSSYYLDAMDNFSPEEYAAFPNINLGVFGQFNSLTLGHLAALRSPASAARDVRPTLLADSGAIMLDSGPFLYAPVTGATGGWAVWGETFGLFGRQANHCGAFGYVYDTSGFSLGVDKTIADDFVVGLVTGYSHSFIDFNDVSFDGDINSLDLGIYGSYNPGAWYIDASFTWARNWHNTERYDVFSGATAEAQYHGDLFAMYLGGGYGFDLGKARITPDVSLTYSYYNQPRFFEDGAGSSNLFVHRFDSHSLVSRIGLKFAYEFDLDSVTIVPEARAEWAHEYLDVDRTIVSRLAAVGLATFAVDGVKPDRDSALLGLGVTAYLGKGFSVYGDYNAELRRNYDSHGFTVGVRYEF